MSLLKKTAFHAAGPALLGVALLAGPTTYAASPSYTFRELELPGGTTISASGVNDAGQVIGSYTPLDGNGSSFFLSEPNGGTLHDLGTLGGVYAAASANGVNDAGQVAGNYALANLAGYTYQAFLSAFNGDALHAVGVFHDRNIINQYGNSNAFAVNSGGQVAGCLLSDDGYAAQAFFTDGQGASHLLGFLSGGSGYSIGRGINWEGQVTGESSLADGSARHAFLSEPNGGPLHDLGTLGGDESRGSAVNDAGQVTGYAFTVGNDLHAFLSDPGGGALHDLGTLSGSTSVGDAVDNAGQVVGYSSIFAGTGQDAFLYTGGRMLDLNGLIANDTGGFHLAEATGISNTGFITGYGFDASGRVAAFLLIPNFPVNPGPRMTVTATASAVRDGQRQISITITDGGARVNSLRITSATLDGDAALSGLPALLNMLSPGQSRNAAFVFAPPGTGRGVLRVKGDYTDPTSGRTGQFGGTLRLTLP